MRGETRRAEEVVAEQLLPRATSPDDLHSEKDGDKKRAERPGLFRACRCRESRMATAERAAQVNRSGKTWQAAGRTAEVKPHGKLWGVQVLRTLLGAQLRRRS